MKSTDSKGIFTVCGHRCKVALCDFLRMFKEVLGKRWTWESCTVVMATVTQANKDWRETTTLIRNDERSLKWSQWRGASARPRYHLKKCGPFSTQSQPALIINSFDDGQNPERCSMHTLCSSLLPGDCVLLLCLSLFHFIITCKCMCPYNTMYINNTSLSH